MFKMRDYEQGRKDSEEAARKESELLETLAKERERDVLADAPRLNREYELEFKNDSASYMFECRRWGDFLSLFIKRGEQNYAGAINLNAVKEIKLEEGHAPDDAGEVKYILSHEYTDKEYKNRREIAHAERPVLRRRELFALDYSPQEINVSNSAAFTVLSGFYGGRHNHQRYAVFRTKNYPRPASDDKIRLNGLGAEIFAPSGKGQMVVDAILKEAGKWVAKAA